METAGLGVGMAAGAEASFRVDANDSAPRGRRRAFRALLERADAITCFVAPSVAVALSLASLVVERLDLMGEVPLALLLLALMGVIAAGSIALERNSRQRLGKSRA